MTKANKPAAWVEQAACASASPESWFPEGSGTRPTQARAICATCPVRSTASNTRSTTAKTKGLWAGFTGRELRRIRHDDQERADIFAALGAA